MSTYVQKQFTVDNTKWWPIQAPVDCNSWTIRCDTVDVTTRSDSSDSTTQDVLPEGTPEGPLQTAFAPSVFQSTRYKANDTVIYVQTSVSAVIVGKFLL